MEVDKHEKMQSLQFNKPNPSTGSSEGRTKWLLYDQDYTRWLYSCLCWDSHLFKTTTSNISKAQWSHLASQSMENSFTTLPRALQRQIMLGWTKGTLILPSLFMHTTLLLHISYQYFFNLSYSSAKTLYWCTNHNQCKVRSTPVKPITPHLQYTDNPSYCLPVCSLASLQWFAYSHSSSASEPKKTSLMQFCCNISPLPVADTINMTTVIFLLWLRWSMLVSSELQDPETHPENLSHVSHPPLWDHKQTCTEVKAARIKTGYFCSSSQRYFPIKVSKINRYLSSVALHNFFANKTIGWKSL